MLGLQVSQYSKLIGLMDKVKNSIYSVVHKRQLHQRTVQGKKCWPEGHFMSSIIKYIFPFFILTFSCHRVCDRYLQKYSFDFFT